MCVCVCMWVCTCLHVTRNTSPTRMTAVTNDVEFVLTNKMRVYRSTYILISRLVPQIPAPALYALSVVFSTTTSREWFVMRGGSTEPVTNLSDSSWKCRSHICQRGNSSLGNFQQDLNLWWSRPVSKEDYRRFIDWHGTDISWMSELSANYCTQRWPSVKVSEDVAVKVAKSTLETFTVMLLLQTGFRQTFRLPWGAWHFLLPDRTTEKNFSGGGPLSCHR